MGKPSESVPDLIETPPGHFMTFWVIWDHPDDAPHAYVLRPQFLCDKHPGNGFFGKVAEATAKHETVVSPLKWYANDPDELRAIIPFGFTRLPRQAGDPPHLMETWV